MDNMDKAWKKFRTRYQTALEELISQQKSVSSSDLPALRQKLYETLTTTTNSLLDALAAQEVDLSPDHIEADNVSLEVIDKHSGKLFRRDLPLTFSETDNGLTLTGENLAGESSQIAFLSEAALQKINDLTGRGLDKPRCS